MENLACHVHRSIRSYWRRNTYQTLKLDPSAPSKRRVRVVRLGEGSTNNRRFWKVRPIRRLGVKISSPIRILTRLRDAYVDAIIAFGRGEGRESASKGQDALWRRRIPQGRQISRVGPVEFERVMVFGVSKSLLAPWELYGLLKAVCTKI